MFLRGENDIRRKYNFDINTVNLFTFDNNKGAGKLFFWVYLDFIFSNLPAPQCYEIVIVGDIRISLIRAMQMGLWNDTSLNYSCKHPYLSCIMPPGASFFTNNGQRLHLMLIVFNTMNDKVCPLGFTVKYAYTWHKIQIWINISKIEIAQ